MIKIESNETYHADKEHINNSILKTIEDSPAHFFQEWKFPKEKKVSDAQKRGQLIHDLLLLQDISKYVRRPVDKTGKQINGNSGDYKEWLSKLAPGQVPTDIELFDSMKSALDAFADHKEAMRLYNGAKIEQSIYTKCPHTGLKIKARPDIWGKDYIVDLKSSGPIFKYYPNEIYRRDYDLQLAHYAETIEAETGSSILRFYIMAFEYEAPFGIKIFEIPQKHIAEAKERRLGYLNTIKVCQAENHWPAYSDEIVLAEKPKFLDKVEKSIFDEVG